MTNAEKVVAIAENNIEICNALNDERVTVSGESVRMDDLWIKNLFNYKDFVAYCNTTGGAGVGSSIENDTFLGEECFSFKSWGSDTTKRYVFDGIKENTQYTFSFEHAMTYNGNESYPVPLFMVYYTDGSSEYVSPMGYSTKFVRSTFTTKAGKTVVGLRMAGFGAQGVLYVKKNMQIEVGTTATEYEPYDKANITRPMLVGLAGKNLLPITRELSFPTDNGFSVGCNITSPFVFSMTFNVTEVPTPTAALFQLDYSDGTFEYITANYWNLQNVTGVRSSSISKNNGKTLVKVSILNWCSLTGTIYNLQIEEGTTATAYTPYVDVNGVTMKRYGKNLFDPSVLLVAGGWKEENGVYSGNALNLYNVYKRVGGLSMLSGVFAEKTQYTISLKATDASYKGINVGCIFVYKEPKEDGSVDIDTLWIDTDPNVTKSFSMTSREGKTIAGIHMAMGSGLTLYLSEFQVEVGQGSSYEQYKEPITYTADENGNVKGVTSLYPTTTLIADSTGVNITAEYFTLDSAESLSKVHDINEAIKHASELTRNKTK